MREISASRDGIIAGRPDRQSRDKIGTGRRRFRRGRVAHHPNGWVGLRVTFRRSFRGGFVFLVSALVGLALGRRGWLSVVVAFRGSFVFFSRFRSWWVWCWRPPSGAVCGLVLGWCPGTFPPRNVGPQHQTDRGRNEAPSAPANPGGPHRTRATPRSARGGGGFGGAA